MLSFLFLLISVYFVYTVKDFNYQMQNCFKMLRNMQMKISFLERNLASIKNKSTRSRTNVQTQEAQASDDVLEVSEDMLEVREYNPISDIRRTTEAFTNRTREFIETTRNVFNERAEQNFNNATSSLGTCQDTSKEDGSSLLSFLGQNLMVWVAGLAAVLGGFYLIRLSLGVLHGVIGPVGWTVLSYLGGFLLISIGMKLYQYREHANNERISQALMGSGVALLYFASYAVSKVYGLAEEGASFVLMSLVTVGAVYLTLHGGKTVVAGLTLLGGFLTPMLISQNGEVTFFLSFYLLSLAMGLIYIATMLESFIGIVLVLLCVYGWSIAMFFFDYQMFSSVWVMLLVIGTSFMGGRSLAKIDSSVAYIVRALLFVCCFLFGCGFVVHTNFGMLEWGIVGLMVTALVYLSFKDRVTYMPYLMVSSLVVFCLLCFCDSGNMYLKQTVFWVDAGLALMPFYFSILKNVDKDFSAYVSVLAPLFYLGYWYLFGKGDMFYIVGLAGAALLILPLLKMSYIEEVEKASGGFLVMSAISLLTVGGALYFSTVFWPIIICVEMCVLSIVYQSGTLKYLGRSIFYLGCILAFLMWYPISVALQVLLFPIINTPFYLGKMTIGAFVSYGIIPFVTFLEMSVIFSNPVIKRLMRCLSFGVFIALVVMGCLVLDNSINQIVIYGLPIPYNILITNALVLVGVLGLTTREKNVAYYLLLGISFWRMIMLYSLIKTNIDIVLFYGVPMVLFYAISFELRTGDSDKNGTLLLGSLFLFIMVTMLMNNIPGLGGFVYSLVWFVLGVIWIFMAFYNRVMIKPAFYLVYFVTAKVFISDVSGLSDLGRVISLFLLAGSLFFISHIYTSYFREINDSARMR